uniref:hypothetical protein n=1 Tax=uncultured Veillonella sp. TaxID=159268 RepID=UPI0026178274
IEVAKSSFKTANHPQRMTISDSNGTYDFAVEQHITSETVKNQNMKKLEVKVLHENQELISLWTYLWEGVEGPSVNEDSAVYK